MADAPLITSSAAAPSTTTSADVQKAGNNRTGMLTIFKATMVHVFGLTEEQTDMVLKYMRTNLQITALDMQTEFADVNRNALFMLKTALKKEISTEEDKASAAPAGVATESLRKKVATPKTLLQYFDQYSK